MDFFPLNPHTLNYSKHCDKCSTVISIENTHLYQKLNTNIAYTHKNQKYFIKNHYVEIIYQDTILSIHNFSNIIL